MVLEVAGIGLEVRPADAAIRLVTDAAHEAFLSSDPGGDCATVTLAPVGNGRPARARGRTVFDTGTVWRLEETSEGQLLTFRSPLYGNEPYLAVEFDPDYSIGGGETVEGGPHLLAGTMHPFVYPFDEVVYLARLSRGRGVLVHGCGLLHDGRGILLLGTSGAGKSTSARLWAQKPGVTILSDDRIVVRADADGEGYRIYGTPWHGDAGYESPVSAPLGAVFVLEQAPRNRVMEFTNAQAVSQMMVRAFPAMWDRRGLEFAVNFLSQMTGRLPVRKLQFLPETSMIDCVVAALAGDHASPRQS